MLFRSDADVAVVSIGDNVTLNLGGTDMDVAVFGTGNNVNVTGEKASLEIEGEGYAVRLSGTVTGEANDNARPAPRRHAA